MTYRTLNPASEELVESYPTAEPATVDRALQGASGALPGWRESSIERRAEKLSEVADLLDRQADDLAHLMALEMGKPLPQGVAEARKCASGCRHFAERAAEYLADRPVPSEGAQVFVRFDPLGPLLAIMPWNYPFWQFFRFAAPALMAGNPVLLKHAPNTPGCALAIVRLVEEAGFPAGLVQSLFLDNEQVADVIADPRVRGVTLTGSSDAGRVVAAAAGRALKPMVLELGGSDPFIVLDDADLDAAVRVGVTARCQNSGQSCIAAKRFLVHRKIYDEFGERFAARMSAQRVGDPTRPGIDIGPLARSDLRDRLQRQVDDTLSGGASVLCGGRPVEGPGFYYPPTVLSDPAADSPAVHEELFGPVAVLLPFDGDADALTLANGTRYGLGASVWTSDVRRARRLADGLETGGVFVNALVRSDPRLPFGGVKESGFGRELSREGILEFVNTKTVWIE